MKQPIYLMQSDLRWATKPYTSCENKTQTIASSGCGPTCTAMMLDTFFNLKLTPVDTCKLAVDHGFRTKADGTDWSFYPWIAKKFDLKLEQVGPDKFKNVVEALKKGALVICSMTRKSAAERGYFTSSGHYILLWGLDAKGMMYANDPISKIRTNVPVNQDIFKTQCKQFFIFTKKG